MHLTNSLLSLHKHTVGFFIMTSVPPVQSDHPVSSGNWLVSYVLRFQRVGKYTRFISKSTEELDYNLEEDDLYLLGLAY